MGFMRIGVLLVRIKVDGNIHIGLDRLTRTKGWLFE